MDRLFIISLGVILLAVGMLFLYFRNKVGKMEKKVDLMFQLIQEYDQQRLQAPPVHMTGGMNQSIHHMTQENMENAQANNQNLINVSDDEEDDTDSEEISDSDEEEGVVDMQAGEHDDDEHDDDHDEDDDNQIKIGDDELVPVKTITLAGAEFGASSDNQEDMNSPEQSDDLEEISDLEDDEDNTEETETETHELSNEVENPYSLNPDQVVEHLVEKLNENKDTSKNIAVTQEKPFKKMSVKELKQLCKERGFTNFSALRKPKLIELLASV